MNASLLPTSADNRARAVVQKIFETYLASLTKRITKVLGHGPPVGSELELGLLPRQGRADARTEGTFGDGFERSVRDVASRNPNPSFLSRKVGDHESRLVILALGPDQHTSVRDREEPDGAANGGPERGAVGG